MADVTDEGASRTQAPSTLGRRLRYAGPGIVIAVTGVGAGDMVSSLVAGTDFGMVLLWAVVLGAILKYFLTEGIGRWYMASGQTILQGWRSLGRWAIWYFVIYLFIVTFVFGAAVASTARSLWMRRSPVCFRCGPGPRSTAWRLSPSSA